MALAFGNDERVEITKLMKEFAIYRALKIGMKKTSVDSIVEHVNISKGAFYSFYDSKDELFLEIVEDWHTEMYSIALRYLTSDITSNQDKAFNAIFEVCKIMYSKGIFKFYLNDLDHLIENISNTELYKSYHSDLVHIDEVIKFSGIQLSVSEDIAIELVKNIAYTLINASDVKPNYWEALKIIISSVCKNIIA